MARLIPLMAVLLICPTLLAQEPAYEPSYDNPDGEEMVLVFVSSTWCAGNRAPGIHEAIEEAKLTIAGQASKRVVGGESIVEWIEAGVVLE